LQGQLCRQPALKFLPSARRHNPKSQGLSSARLDVIQERLAAKKTRAFLVVRNDHMVYEWSAPALLAPQFGEGDGESTL
jgi:hypothetical protein